MRPATSVDELLATPVARYLAGRSYIVWSHGPTLIGTVYFAVPDERDFTDLQRLFELPGHPGFREPYDVLVDCSALEALPPHAFEFLGRYLEVARRYASRMRRVSIVRPQGMAGVVLAGVFYELVRGTFAAGLFADREEAARWLAHPGAPAACAELDALLDEVRATPPELRRLREYLARHVARPTLAEAARALRLSTRSLQRSLAAARTSFRRQVEHARVRAAEALLAGRDLKIEAVAHQVGYSSLAHFTVAFRRATGESPSEFRARRAG